MHKGYFNVFSVNKASSPRISEAGIPEVGQYSFLLALITYISRIKLIQAFFSCLPLKEFQFWSLNASFTPVTVASFILLLAPHCAQ